MGPDVPTATGTTRERLLDEAELLFARRGVDRVTSREIVEAAEQRNVSAVSYHFGSREGLLLEVLARRGGPVDVERGRRRDELGAAPELDALVGCLVHSYVELLDHAPGRSYVRIVAQLRGRFAAWRVESDAATTTHLARILNEIESQMAGPPARRGERIVGFVMLLTGMAAERARTIDENVEIVTDDDAFVEDLVAMCAAVLAG